MISCIKSFNFTFDYNNNTNRNIFHVVFNFQFRSENKIPTRPLGHLLINISLEMGGGGVTGGEGVDRLKY